MRPTPAFAGFGPQALGFLKALAFHQDKAWYEENRAIYEAELKAPLEALVAALTAAFAEAGLPLQGSPKSIFRLHRDTRFSKDKRPYKTNAGAVLTRDGAKRNPGLLYIHVDPEGCFAAAGFYHAEPDHLLSLRRAIVGRPGDFRAALKKLRRAGLVLGDGDPLARLPKGFEGLEDEHLAVAVRMRNLVVRRPIPPEVLQGPGLVHDLVAFARDAAPLLRFGWGALDPAGR